MFDQPVEELDATEASDALVAAHRAIRAAEARLFVLAAHWADLHDGAELTGGPVSLPGQQLVVPIRGGRTGCVEGCPEIAEYAAAELAALTGRSTVAGEQLVADAVAVRHRHRLLWSAVRAGTAPTWVAAQVARRCIRANLTAAQAEWVDAETSPSVTTLPTSRFLDLVDAKIIETDPDAAQERSPTWSRCWTGSRTRSPSAVMTGRWRCCALRRCGCWPIRPGRRHRPRSAARLRCRRAGGGGGPRPGAPHPAAGGAGPVRRRQAGPGHRDPRAPLRRCPGCSARCGAGRGAGSGGARRAP